MVAIHMKFAVHCPSLMVVESTHTFCWSKEYCLLQCLRSEYSVCPTRYRARHFFNNFTTNEDIVTNFEADCRHIPLHFSHTERTPFQISLQYTHWC